MSLRIMINRHFDGAPYAKDLVEELLSYHPEYLNCFLKCHSVLMDGDGPLEDHVRRYIAIMGSCLGDSDLAASRHQCACLVEDYKRSFLELEGPPKWLEGLDSAPKKLQTLNLTNCILAHQPWLYNRSHVEELLSYKWSVSELTHAICIMIHIHALSCFIHGCGAEDGASLCDPSYELHTLSEEAGCSSSPSSIELSKGGVEVLLDRMQKLSFSEALNVSQEAVQKNFEKLKAHPVVSGTYSEPHSKYNSFSKFSPPVHSPNGKLPGRGDKFQIPTVNFQDYSWDEQGYSLLSDLYSEVVNLIDEKLKTAYHMTYYTCGDNVHVDTSPFRMAVWNYLHCLYGIRHDDYDYSQVNKLVERGLRVFLKTTSYNPERIYLLKDTPQILKEFSASERIHLLIILSEAKMQAALVYGLRALSQYLL